MKKLMLSVLATAALTAGGAALAQDGGAGCQAGSAWGPQSGCGAGPSGPGVQQHPHPSTYGPNNWPQVPQYAPYGRYYGPHAGVLPAYPYDDRDRRFDGNRRERERDRDRDRARNNRDRDHDGVRNNRDRFPDDPSRF
jgi:hypothetical protein